MEIKDQAVVRELAGLGLPLSMHPGDAPDPPFDTPFSGVVHFLAKLTRGCALCLSVTCHILISQHGTMRSLK